MDVFTNSGSVCDRMFHVHQGSHEVPFVFPQLFMLSPVFRSQTLAMVAYPLHSSPITFSDSVFVDTAVAISATVFLLCVAVVIPATVFLLCWCGPCRSCSPKIFGQEWLAMVFKRREGVRGSKVEERAEKVLASAISIGGRQEWTCKFCSASNVWTRWRCSRCYHDIPAALRGKYRQAIAARTGERSTGSSTSSGEEDRKSKQIGGREIRSFGPKLRLWRRREGKELREGKAFHPGEEGGMEEEWGMDMDVEDRDREPQKVG